MFPKLVLMLVPLCAGLTTPPLRVAPPTVPTAQQMAFRASVDHAPESQQTIALFPSEESAATTQLLAADAEARTPEEDAEAKGRGRLILGVIVANSIFWQYVLPVFKGQPTSTGRKKK